MSMLAEKLKTAGAATSKRNKIILGVVLVAVIGYAASSVVGGGSSTPKPKAKPTATANANGATANGAGTGAGNANGAPATIPTTTPYAPSPRNPFTLGTAASTVDAATAATVHSADANAKLVFADQGNWHDVTAAALKSLDANSFAAPENAAVSGPGTVSWHRTGRAGTEDGIVIAAQSASGRCYLMRELSGTTSFGAYTASETNPCAATGTRSAWSPDEHVWS